MRGFKNFKGSDASGPSIYSYSMTKMYKEYKTNKEQTDNSLLELSAKVMSHDSFTIVQTIRANQNTNLNSNEDYFALQLQEYKEKHSSNYTRFRKQTERDNLLLDDSCIVVQRKDANQINNRNNNKKRTQRLQKYEEN